MAAILELLELGTGIAQFWRYGMYVCMVGIKWSEMLLIKGIFSFFLVQTLFY